MVGRPPTDHFFTVQLVHDYHECYFENGLGIANCWSALEKKWTYFGNIVEKKVGKSNFQTFVPVHSVETCFVIWKYPQNALEIELP